MVPQYCSHSSVAALAACVPDNNPNRATDRSRAPGRRSGRGRRVDRLVSCKALGRVTTWCNRREDRGQVVRDGHRHRLGGCQVAWGARELHRRRPSQTPQWTPGRVPSAALPEAAAAFPSGLIVHVVVFCAGMNVSVVRSAGGGRWSNPPSPPGASRVRGEGTTSNI